jgi:hypothetical protein
MLFYNNNHSNSVMNALFHQKITLILADTNFSLQKNSKFLSNGIDLINTYQIFFSSGNMLTLSQQQRLNSIQHSLSDAL